MMFCGKPNLYLSRFHLDQENATGNRSSVRDASANSNRGFSVNFAPLVTMKNRKRNVAPADMWRSAPMVAAQAGWRVLNAT
jgi:hypothetical protein